VIFDMRMHLIYLSIIILSAFRIDAQEMPVDSCQHLDAEAFFVKMQEEDHSLLIDTRTYDEFARQRISGAILVESKAKLAEMADSLDLDRSLFFYCEEGQRAPVACQLLKARGFRKVYNLKGGLISWRLQGYKLDKRKIKAKRRVR
jgi:rhodanese-related sulfurtransferase